MMQLAAKNLCRGQGKLFFDLEILNLKSGAWVSFVFTAKDGREVPGIVFPAGSPAACKGPSQESSFTVCIPNTRQDVRITAVAFDPKTGTHAEAAHVIRARQAQIEGRMNSIARKDEVALIRDCDERKTLDRCVFEFWDFLAPVGGNGLLRGCARIPTLFGETLPALTALDADLNPLPQQPHMFPARMRTQSTDMTAPYWEIPFSVPASSADALVVIAAVDEDGDYLPGFGAVEQEYLAYLQTRMACMYDNAQWTPRYEEWYREHRATESELALQRAAAVAEGAASSASESATASTRTSETAPTFSIIVPLYKTPLTLLHEMADSVLAQTYPHWQLVLANASPEDAELTAAVQNLAERDARIVAVPLERNAGITLNTRAGIEHATGDFICFLDHDDTIEPDALFEYAKALAAHPDTDLLYCDEDHLLPDGTHTFPFFKPDFSIDLLRSINYVCHMLAIRRTLLDELPKQDESADGAQDHDLTLMASEKARRITHVPKILYHWRRTEGSTADSGDNKQYANDAGIRAVRAHLQRLGIAADVQPGEVPFTYNVRYEVQGEPLVSIIIPNKDHIDLLDACLKSIFQKSTYGNFEVVVIENNSTQPATFAYYEKAAGKWPAVRVVTWPHTGFNYAEIMNFGVQEARGDYLLLLNNDIEVITPDWIQLMLGTCQREDVGVVGARLYFPDDTIQHAGVGLTGGTAEHLGKFLPRSDRGYFGVLSLMRNYSAVTAACAMTKRSIFEQVGGFEPQLAVAFNDVDFCLKVCEAGKLVVYDPHVELYHFESISRGQASEHFDTEVQARHEANFMQDKWVALYINGDPYLNPNLDRGWPAGRYFNLKD